MAPQAQLLEKLGQDLVAQALLLMAKKYQKKNASIPALLPNSCSADSSGCSPAFPSTWEGLENVFLSKGGIRLCTKTLQEAEKGQ